MPPLATRKVCDDLLREMLLGSAKAFWKLKAADGIDRSPNTDRE